MARVTDEDLVERNERLSVVERRLDHRPRLVRRGAGRDRFEDGLECFWSVRHEDAGVPSGLRVDADHRLSVQVLRDVGDEPVLTDDCDDVIRGEEEAVEVGPLDVCPTPVDRDRGGRGRKRSLDRGVTLVDLFEAAATRAEKEARLAPRAVPRDELVELRSTMDDDDARREAHRFPATCASASPRTSGASVSRSIAGRLAASSLRASPRRIGGWRSRVRGEERFLRFALGLPDHSHPLGLRLGLHA